MLLSERRTFQTSRGYTYSFIYVPPRDAKPTFLLLHGFPSHADDWEPQISRLAARGYGVVAPDLLGFGASSTPNAVAAYALRGMSDDLAEVLDHLQLPAVVAVAHDLGANLLGRAAAYHPRHFQGLVFLAVGSGKPARGFDVEAIQRMTEEAVGFVMFGYLSWLGGEGDPHRVLEEHAEAAMSLLFAADGGRVWNEWFHPLGAMERFVTEDRRVPVGVWYTPAMQKAHLEVFAARDGYKGATRWYRMLVTNASLAEEEEALADARLEQPSIIVADAQSMPPQQGMLAEWVPNLTAKEVKSGHWLHIECADQVNQIITEFADSL
ncbi:Epoxide hydrolase-like protein [Cordyceps fumosorosea ARSEF 2679]|uniref:Epoxide hydrolase-like protein n=1 Tax=Cordyceps fumosorosea (strain ARSEF 2679) TaxID=1081104 RepID=A0A167N512_CORFA|nr:Epoxide hydrolase-like protein [Cordyceps fumosorosea ARSEF 2679]OAA55134.1 Epoxide hydrolase-like protein [Cordyceps fumosorosea ARSEF 2679]